MTDLTHSLKTADSATDQACPDVPCSQRRSLVAATAAVGGIGLFGATIPFLASMAPTGREKATSAPIEVDIGVLEAGQMLSVVWQGQPIWILRRNSDMMARLAGHDDALADPRSEKDDIPAYCRNAHRSRADRSDILVLVGLCTHLGCSPIAELASGVRPGLPDNWPGGFLCPCHGSTFDLAGRVFKNKPAPNNLRIPPYRFSSNTLVRIGDDETTNN